MDKKIKNINKCIEIRNQVNKDAFNYKIMKFFTQIYKLLATTSELRTLTRKITFL